jgi:hypothetical protein
MKIEPKMTPELRAEIKAAIGKSKPLPPVSHVGRKTAGQTGLSGVEAAFIEYASNRDWRIIAKEPLSIYVLEGRAYTPDFLIADGDDLVFVETKSERPLPNEERAEDAFEDASKRTPQFSFLWARQRGDGFDLAYLRGGVPETRR